MKNIFKLMMIISIGLMIFQSCEEGDISMPDLGSGAVKNLENTGDPLIIVDDPGAFQGAMTLDVISDNAVGSVEFSVIWGTDTALIQNVTSFPYVYNFTISDLATLFPDDANYINNTLAGGDAFTFITGNIFMADGTELFADYEFEVKDTTETGADTLVTLDVTGNSPDLVNIMTTGIWRQEQTVYVGCPFDPAEAAGTYTIVNETWWEESYVPSLTGQTVEVIAGPGADQITIIDPFKFDENYGSGPYPVVVTVDPAGYIFADVEKQAICHFDSTSDPIWDWGYGEGRVEGGGLCLSCIGVIDLAWELTVDAGSFGTFGYTLNKN